MKIKQSERGQALYLLVVGIVSLIGFTALAIDGGRLFSERRTIQGVSDTAAFTGAVYLGRAVNVDEAIKAYAVLAANEIAISNGYNDADDDVSVNTTVTVDDYYYVVTTQISSQIDPTFAQLVYSGPLEVEAQAVTRVLPLYQTVFGNALFSLNETDCDALYFSGNSDIQIDGTGIFSNSDCSSESVSFEGNNLTIVDGEVSAAGGVNTQGAASYTATETNEDMPQVPSFSLPIPDCSGLPPVSISGPSNNLVITPGIVNSLFLNGATKIYNFQPGLYCITGSGGFTITNGTVNGTDVMFYLTDGEVRINGGLINLTAPTNDSVIDASNESWNGMLFYLDPTNTSEVWINGNAGSYFEGTVYAPSSLCHLNGSGFTDGIDLSMICDSIDVDGGAGLHINYTDSNHYHPPTTIDLLE
ncbi:MAG: Tad domain-containing protein [Anaerolineales bacterium]